MGAAQQVSKKRRLKHQRAKFAGECFFVFDLDVGKAGVSKIVVLFELDSRGDHCACV